MNSRRWYPRRGQVVLVDFPFVKSDGQIQTKLRPAVVVSSPVIHRHTTDVLIAAISSRPRSRSLPTDYEIRYGTPAARSAGLKKNSWVKASNLVTVPKEVVSRRLGFLTSRDLREVDRCLRIALDFPETVKDVKSK